MVNLEIETRDGVAGAKKRFLGVTKEKTRWVARVQNPMLRVDVRLGTYRTPEEAAFAVQKKKAEFEEMLKSEDKSSMGTFRGYFKGKKLPSGVSWDNGRYRVQIWDPKLKKSVSGGSYKTCEEAADAANRKREEFREMYGEVKVPPGVRRTKSGKWSVRMKKPDSKGRISLGTYNTLEEAISSFNKKKAEFDVKLKKSEFKPGDGLLDMSPTTVFVPKNLNNAPGSDKSCDSDFDRAVSLGIINEYGQLLGKYSELDTNMGLSLAEENVADSVLSSVSDHHTADAGVHLRQRYRDTFRV